MTQILFSLFRGFNRTTGTITLIEKLKEIGTTNHQVQVDKIRALVREDKKEEAANVKKQLPACKLSATYKKRRLPEQISSYTDLIMINIDGLEERTLNQCWKQIIKASGTLFCFVSPSGNALKAGVYLATNEVQLLREIAFRKSELTYEELERYHKQYTGRADDQEKDKKKPMALRVIESIRQNYDIRRNTVMERLEPREKKITATE